MDAVKRRIPIAEAKARFAECVRSAERGDDVILTRHGRPVARLVGLGPARGRPTPGEGSGARPGLAVEVRDAGEVYEVRSGPAVAPRGRLEALERLLEREIWPRVPEELLGKGVSKREREEILGLEEGAD